MSSRHKGSSRSTRDDSRPLREHRGSRDRSAGERSRDRSPGERSRDRSAGERSRDRSPGERSRDRSAGERARRRSRSRSPRRRSPDPHDTCRDRPHRSNYYRENSRNIDSRKDDYWEGSEQQAEVPAPPPPPRITKIRIGFSKPRASLLSAGGAGGATRAAVFNADDDDEPEEMPAEARMRMRNIGRETPTSAGPNSFGKTKQGFCDAKKVFEKNLKQALETADKPPTPKFPQTIYKIGP